MTGSPMKWCIVNQLEACKTAPSQTMLLLYKRIPQAPMKRDKLASQQVLGPLASQENRLSALLWGLSGWSKPGANWSCNVTSAWLKWPCSSQFRFRNRGLLLVVCAMHVPTSAVIFLYIAVFLGKLYGNRPVFKRWKFSVLLAFKPYHRWQMQLVRWLLQPARPIPKWCLAKWGSLESD